MAKRVARHTIRNTTRHAGRGPRRRDPRRVVVWGLIVSFVVAAGLASVAGAIVLADDRVAEADASVQAIQAWTDALNEGFAETAMLAARDAPTAAPVVVPAAVAASPSATTASGPLFAAGEEVDDCLPREPGDVDPFTCCPNDIDCDGLDDEEETQLYSEFFDQQPYDFSARCDFSGGANENPDIDCDGLTDGWEYHVTGTRIFDADSDGGGVDDGLEVLRYGTDPLDPTDDPVDSDADATLRASLNGHEPVI